MPRKDSDLVKFGRNVRRRRRELGLTQEDLAGDIGFSAPYLSEIENGRRDVGVTRLIALAKALSVSLDELALGHESEVQPPGPIETIARRINDLPRSRQDAALQVLDVLKKLDG